MTNQQIIAAALSTDPMTVVEINDWAVNTVREYCSEKGYNAPALVAEETRRIDSEAPSLDAYLKVHRTGSRFLLSRVVRRAVWATVVSRRTCRTLGL